MDNSNFLFPFLLANQSKQFLEGKNLSVERSFVLQQSIIGWALNNPWLYALLLQKAVEKLDTSKVVTLPTDVAILQAELSSLKNDNALLTNKVAQLEAKEAAQATEITGLRNDNKTLKDQVAGESAKVAEAATKISALQTENSGLKLRITALETKEAALMADKTNLETKVSVLEKSKAALDALVAKQSGEIQVMRGEKAELERQILLLKSDINTLTQEKNMLSKQLTQAELRFTQFENSLRQRLQKKDVYVSIEDGKVVLIDPVFQGVLDAQDFKAGYLTYLKGFLGKVSLTLEASAETAAEAPSSSTRSIRGITNSDDLALIIGIGKAIKAFLEEKGITNFYQLASLTERELDSLLAASKVKLGPTAAALWIEQAKLLAEGKTEAWEEWKKNHKN